MDCCALLSTEVCEMAVDTYIEKAQTRVRSEQEAIEEKVDAYETFVRRVAKLQTDRSPASVADMTTAVGATHLSTDASSTDRCRMVQAAFAKTIRPHSVDDIDDSESVLDTIRAEFTDAIAVALAPTTDTSFTPELKKMILAEARSRRSEATALRKTLGRESAQPADAAEEVDGIIAWLFDANEAALADLGFGALQRRHETLASHRDRCEELARERQAFLEGTTNDGIDVGVRHRSVLPYLYQDFPVDHPVLATAAKLDQTCRECQRAVRDHLVRRA